MHSADYAVARCLSVCHTPVFCLAIHIPKVFSPSDSPTIVVFANETGREYSDGDTPYGGVKCKGV